MFCPESHLHYVAAQVVVILFFCVIYWVRPVIDSNEAMFVQLARNVLSLMKSAPHLGMQLPASHILMKPRICNISAIEMILVPMQVHGAMWYGLNGWRQFCRGRNSWPTLSQWAHALQAWEPTPSNFPETTLVAALHRARLTAREDIFCGLCDTIFGISFSFLAMWSMHAISYDTLMLYSLTMEVVFIPPIVAMLRDSLRSFKKAWVCRELAGPGGIKVGLSLQRFEALGEEVSLVAWPWEVTDDSASISKRFEETASKMKVIVKEKTTRPQTQAMDRKSWKFLWFAIDEFARTWFLNFAAFWCYLYDPLWWLGAELFCRKYLSVGVSWPTTHCDGDGCWATAIGDVAWTLEPALLFFFVMPLRWQAFKGNHEKEE